MVLSRVTHSIQEIENWDGSGHSRKVMQNEFINPALFVNNRQRLASLMIPNSLAVVNSNDTPVTNADGSLALPANSDLFYLSGVQQEQSILLLYPDAMDENHREILFLREPTPLAEIWEGRKLTKERARAETGIKTVEWLSTFPALFHRLMCESEHVYLNSNEHKRATIETETREARFVRDTQTRYPLHHYQRLARLLHQIRVVKSDLEIELIRKACQITDDGFRRVLNFVKPGVNEREIEAEFAHEFIRQGGRFAYLPIIGSGRNACVLHYIENSQRCAKGELILLDVAASFRNYNSDLTRTIPVSGKFSRRQKAVYKAVLSVLRASIAGLVPGKTVRTWQAEAEQLIERECVNLGLLTLREIKRQNPDCRAVRKYFMHGLGHPIGLDVHDVGFTTQPMQAGWVMTVEPAIYIPEEKMAVRLENDVLLTENGPVDLMGEIPIEVDEIEALMNR